MGFYTLNILGIKVSVKLRDLSDSDLDGFYEPKKNQIVLDSNLEKKELYKTLIHETIHAAFHRASIVQAVENGVEEIICDLVATVLTENFHITKIKSKKDCK